MGAILDAALEYAEAGLSVFPVKRSDKSPYTEHGLKDASKDAETIKRWWKQYPDANVAIACGEASNGLLVVDVDIKPSEGKRGDESLHYWEAQYGDFPETVVAKTGSGGIHYYLKANDLSNYKNTVDALPGVDIRGDGAYVVAPPSVYADGRVYEWQRGVSASDVDEIAPANQSVYGLLNLNRKGSQTTPKPTTKTSVRNVAQGNRNVTLFRYCCLQRGQDVPYEAALAGARAFVATWEPPLSDHEIVKTLNSAYNNYEPNEVTIYGPPQQPEKDDDGNYIPRLPAELTQEFLLNPPPKKKPLVMNYLREGEAMLLSGNPKAGKSFLIVQLAIAVATGTPWIGANCQKKPVLYIDGELSPEMTAERIKDIRVKMGISYFPENLHVINTKKEDVTLKDIADDFEHKIRHEELVIIDPLYMFINSDENDNSQMKKEMEQIKRISATGVAVVVVHHMSKGVQSGKLSIDRASGAGVLGRFFDSILTLNLLNREATDQQRPERVEADTRSFQQPKPVDLWFDGFHTVDTAGDLAERDLNDPKKSMNEQKNANDVGKLNHCYYWMKDNCTLQPDGSFTLESMIQAYEVNYHKKIARTTLAGQLERAGFVKYKGVVEEKVGDKVTRRMKSLYVPDGTETNE